jgi:PKD repeat protein
VTAGWNGPDPVGFSDGIGTHYELGTRYTAVADVTINNVRVWAPVGGAARANRSGKIWSTGGALLASAVMPDTLTPGWTLHALDVPVALTTGTSIIVSYDVTDTYGARVGGFAYPLTSADGLVQAEERRLNATPDLFPPSGAGDTFYGVDIDYTAGIAGNQRPVVGITVTSIGLTASATLTIDDESPGTVSYVIDWGDGQTSAVSGLGPHSHTYAATGTYAVMVTATDNGGLQDSAAVVVIISPPPGSDAVMYTAAAALLTYVKAQLDVTAAGWPINARECVVPGQLAWDECECGLLAVEWLGNVFSNALPAPRPETEDGCNSMLGMTFRVSAIRCAPPIEEGAVAPTCAALDAGAQTQFIDSLAVTRGVAFAAKALEDMNTVLAYSFGGATPTGPQGRCVGVTIDVTFGVVNSVGAC